MRLLFFLFILQLPLWIFAQEVQLFEDLSYQQAVVNGTRSPDGKPGPNYWQNHADYRIEVILDTLAKTISGKSEILYHNESRDSLNSLVFRIYADRDKKGGMRNYPRPAEAVHDGADIDTLIVDGKGYNVGGDKVVQIGTNMRVSIDNQIPPGGNARINIEWTYPLTRPGGRTSYYENNIYFTGYFYPQVAVYDDLNGWDFQLSHIGIQEFYNDVNNYKVKIHVPVNFRVWATGELTNARDVYPQYIVDRIRKASESDKIIHILTAEDLEQDIAMDSIWTFKADGVRDFAFGTSPSQIWDGSSIQSGEKRIAIHSVYPPSSVFNWDAAAVARKTITYTSDTFPGIPYPYVQTTTFVNEKGYGGMEFPMIVNNNDPDDYYSFAVVTFHEIFHNYTPFMLGTNEKRYIWMDEGWARYTTDKFMEAYQESGDYPDSIPIKDVQEDLINQYNNTVVRVEDRPMYDSFLDLNIYNFYFLGYIKPAIAYGYFIDMVGKEKFKSAFVDFIETWEGKHPVPHDFFYSMNRSLGENYNWFWNAWFFDRGYADLAIELQDDRFLVKRMGTGSLPLPVNLTIEYEDGSTVEIRKSMAIWKDGATEYTITPEDFSSVKSAELDTKYTPDINHDNNVVEIN